MKKIYILLALILCTGCTANYEINIKEDKIIENLTIAETNINIFDTTMDNGFSMRKLFNEFTLDSKFSKSSANLEHIDKEDKIGLIYKDEFSVNKLSNSSVLNQCYEEPTVEITDKKIYINTGSEFNCFDYYEYLEEIKIVLKTNYKVNSNNADNVRNNTYVWNLDRTNYNSKSIEIDIDKTKTIDENIYIYIIVAIIAILLLGGLITYNIVNNKSKQVNKF